MNQFQYPQREGEPECRDFLRTGRCKYGDSCKYHHPVGGSKPPSDPNEPPFPIRPNDPPCQYYLKNGTCKFGQTCRFHHPPHMLGKSLSPAQKLTIDGLESGLSHDEVEHLPQRPLEPDCLYYLKHGRCKYGTTCKYHHPSLHKMSSDPDVARYSTAQGQMFFRERTASGTSYTEMREGPSSIISNHMNMYNVQEHHHRRVVDSVPKNILGTISNSYQQYNTIVPPLNNQLPPTHRYQSSLSSSKNGSPSVTSSTLASSFETAGSGFERLPAARAQVHNTPTQSLSFLQGGSMDHHPPLNDAEHGLYSAPVLFGPRQYNSSTGNNQYSPVQGPSSDGTFSSRKQSFSSDFSSNSLVQQIQPLDNSHIIKAPLPLSSFSFENSSSPSRNVDDGLSMMTSALLNMMETPTHHRDMTVNGRRDYPAMSSDSHNGSPIATTPPTSNLAHLHEQYRRARGSENDYAINEISRPLWS